MWLFDWLDWCTVEVSTPLMIHLVLNSSSSLCVRNLSGQRKRWVANLLAKGSGAVILELLVECVTVTDRGNVVTLDA
jgi:hypothetical protein